MKKTSLMAVCLTLTLSAAPALASPEPLRASPPQLQFGNRPVGSTHTRNVSIHNVGGEAAVVFHVSISTGFSIESLTCFDAALEPKRRCEVEVGFTPSTPGLHEGSMLVQYCFLSDPLCPGAVFGQERFITVPLSGRGRAS